MIRSPTAPLSSNEEVTLRRVAYGQSEPRTLRIEDIARLRALGLVEESTGLLSLSAAGRQRFAALATPALINGFRPQLDLVTEAGRMIERAARR